MAKIYPIVPEEFNSSYGEKEIFKVLKRLPDDWNIYYSVSWQKRTRHGEITWGEADFLIFNPEYGILVIEVKSGGIEFIEGKWIQTRLDNYEKNGMKDPFKQADRNKYKIREEISNVLPFGEKCFIDKAVWFPSIDKKELENITLPLEAKGQMILTKEDLDTPLEALKRVFKFYNAKGLTNITNKSQQSIKNIIMPNFKLVPSASNIKDEAEYVFYQLTNEQSKVLDFIADQNTVAIQGTAGTGKTFIAVEQARRFAENGKVLFLCFNRYLNAHLKEKCKNDNVFYYTIHSFLGTEAMGENVFEIETGLKILDSINFERLNYKYIIIDEAQDFDKDILELLYFKCLEYKMKLIIFYDKNQLIFQDALPDIIKNFDCKLTLLRNCRNTEKIAESINTIFDIPMNINELNISGTMPVLHYFEDNEQLINSLENNIRKYLDTEEKIYKENDITILTLNIEETSILKDIHSLAGYKISKVKNDTDIMFTTSRKYKGLESNIIIVVDFNMSKYESEEYKRNFYVALSRARQKLDIFTIVSDDDIKHIAKNIEDDSNLTSYAKIGRKFKMRIAKEK